MASSLPALFHPSLHKCGGLEDMWYEWSCFLLTPAFKENQNTTFHQGVILGMINATTLIRLSVFVANTQLRWHSSWFRHLLTVGAWERPITSSYFLFLLYKTEARW